MNVRKHIVFTLALIAALWAIPAQAGALNKQRVSADAQWVAHVNVEAIAGSKLFKAFMDAKNVDIDLEQVNEIKEQFGVDPFKDIRDATIYGSGNPDEGNMVILANTNANVDQAVSKLKEQLPIVELTITGQTIFKIDQDDEHTFFMVRKGATAADRVVIVAH